MNVNYVVELRAEDVAGTTTPVTIVGAPVIIGCGVFRPYNEESFKKDIEDRIDDPEGFDHEAAFQTAWSGDPFDNADWVAENGDGLTYGEKAGNVAA